jgi:hypothetical protein
VPVVAFFASLLLDVRARIPNRPSFGSDPANSSFGTPLMWTIVFIAVAVLSAVLWLAPNLATGLL